MPLFTEQGIRQLLEESKADGIRAVGGRIAAGIESAVCEGGASRRLDHLSIGITRKRDVSSP